jgi:hypothetical protein
MQSYLYGEGTSNANQVAAREWGSEGQICYRGAKQATCASWVDQSFRSRNLIFFSMKRPPYLGFRGASSQDSDDAVGQQQCQRG